MDGAPHHRQGGNVKGRIVVRAATREGAINVDIDLSSIPFFGSDPFGGKQRGNRRMTGWI